LNFQEGRRLLNIEKTTNPQNDIPYLIENYIDFLTVFIGEKKTEFDNLKNNKDTRLNRIEKGDKSSPYYLYSKAQINLQWSFARMKFGEYFTASVEIVKAFNCIEENSKKFPQFIPNKILQGLMHIIIGSVPDNYKWMTNLTGYKGTVKQGVSELEFVLKNTSNNSEYSYLKNEVAFMLSFMNMNLISENTEKENIIFNLINTKDKIQSPLIYFAAASMAMRKGLNDEAIKILSSRKNSPNTYPFYYLDYMHG